MPAERVNMRRVREMLKYRFEQELGYKAISLRVGAVPSTVRLSARMFGESFGYIGRELFLKTSCAAGSALGLKGRTESRR
jgi:hypothetical protein